MGATVRHVSGRAALAEVAGAFDALVAAADAPVTARRRWLQTWVDVYDGWEPWLVVVHDEQGPAAIAPLARRRRLGVLQVVVLGHGPSDQVLLPARDAAAAEVLAGAIADTISSAPAWWLRLEQQPADDPVVAALVRRLPHTSVEPGDGMPVVRVTGRELTGYLSKNTRKALAKIRNRIDAAGLKPEFAWTSDPADVRAVLPELMRVRRERDLALGRRPDHDDPAAARFYREVLTRHADAGEVDLLTLRLDGDLAAYVCGLRDGRTLRSWDNRLAPRWAELSAGRLANTEAIVRVVTSGDYDALDWMRGEEPYKLQSATEVIPTVHLAAWSSAAVRQGATVAAAVREHARALKRRSPLVSRAVAGVRALR